LDRAANSMCWNSRWSLSLYTLSTAVGGMVDRRAIRVSCQRVPLISATSGQTASATLAESSGSSPRTTAWASNM
jgi:heme A synthase